MNNVEEMAFAKSGWHRTEIITDDKDNKTIFAGKTSYPDDDGSGACWCIRKTTVTTVGSIQTIVEQYADGDNKYDNVWNNRKNLEYKYY